MKIILQQEEFLQNMIRDCMAVNPLVSIRGMQKIVEKNTGRSISDKYTSKLMHKIRRRAIIQSDRTKMNERLAEVRERYRVLIRDLSRIIYWRRQYLMDHGIRQPSLKERLAAMKLQAQLELALFRAELDAGMFENKQTAINEMLQQGVLPTELHEQVIGVFRTWKLKSAHQEPVTTSNFSVMSKAIQE